MLKFWLHLDTKATWLEFGKRCVLDYNTCFGCHKPDFKCRPTCTYFCSEWCWSHLSQHALVSTEDLVSLTYCQQLDLTSAGPAVPIHSWSVLNKSGGRCMYCAADVSWENPANCLLNFMKSEHGVEHDEITVKLLYTLTLVTQFKDQNTGQTSWKLSFHLSGKSCQKSCPDSFIPPRVGVCSSASLCMGAMYPCLYLLSNVSKERQPVKKKKKKKKHTAQTTYLTLVLLSAWRVEPLL